MPDERGPDDPAATPAQDAQADRAALAQLAFVRSAYGTAEGTIRLADEKFGYVLLFHGILAAILSVQAEGLLKSLASAQHPWALRGVLLAGGLVFLGAAGISLAYALRSRGLAFEPPKDVPGFLAHLARLETQGLAEELAGALHRAAAVAQRKLALLEKCFTWAAVAFAGWAVALVMTLAT
jgi:hypothetical protein